MEPSPVAQWLGGPYQIILREPAGERVVGILRSLVPEQHLTLDQATILSTGQTHPQLDIHAANVSDIIPLHPSEFTSPPPPPVAIASPPANHDAFQDPAILSMSRKPVQEKKQTNICPNPADRLTYSSPDETDTTTAVPLETPFASLSVAPPQSTTIVDTTEDEAQNLTPTAATAKTTRPSGRRRGKRGKRQDPQQQENDPPQPSSARPTNQGKGWRQTPILQSTKSFQPFASLRRNQKGRGDADVDTGWASEDVTDVQGAGDFDFEGSLAKFDKRTIFNEMREQDQVDEADRLVSHNRLPRPKPGTAGGRNLHYSENVLDMPSSAVTKGAEYWRSDADDGDINGGDDILSGRDGSGRTSRLRAESRMSTTRRSQSRKASATNASVGGPSRVNSGVSLVPPRGPRASRNADLSPSKLPNPSSTTTGLEGLYTSTNRRVETVTHLQMLVVENVASNELGLTEDLMAENAGRGICEVAFRALDDPATKLHVAAASPPSTSTIVVLAGNNKSGARAVAAARHLRNRNIQTLVCIVGFERERELLDDLRRQVRLYRNFGGVVYTKSELFEHLVQSADNLGSSSPQVAVTLIVDALLGLTISFEELRKSDQATTYELMEWSNRNGAFVIAIDVPSGIEPSSGKVNVIDGAKLYVEPRYVVALGAPKQGLLKALESVDEPGGISMADEWMIYLADIGLGTLVWRKAATKGLRRGIDFDNGWVLGLQHRRRVED